MGRVQEPTSISDRRWLIEISSQQSDADDNDLHDGIVNDENDIVETVWADLAMQVLPDIPAS